jgi:hypothetical protein
MISILICSVNPDYLQRVTDNISQTIGVDYELLVQDNRKENQPLCTVYNKLAAQSKFPFLLFLHEDVAFQTKNWGKLLLDQLTNNAQRGVVGIAGSAYKSVIPSGWFTGLKDKDFFNIVHDDKGKIKKIIDAHDPTLIAAEVKVLDGVFLACHKSVWEDVRFNDDLLKGFHFYDIDFSIRASDKYKNIVMRNIDLIHYTKGGDFGEPWVKAAFIFHRKYNKWLSGPDHFTSFANDAVVFSSWLNLLKNEKINFTSRLKWIYIQRRFISFRNFYDVIRFLIYRPLGLYKLHAVVKSAADE